MTDLRVNPPALSMLARRVLDLGVCPVCHTKTIKETAPPGFFRQRTCLKCKQQFLTRNSQPPLLT